MQHQISVLGLDIAKRVFHAVGLDAMGKIVFRKPLARHALMSFIAKLPPVLIGMEACGGAHYWARRFRAHGHEVKLMAPQFVKPYVKSNKNDARDAEAIGEAVTRPTMRFVPIKAIDQQNLQALHRVRDRLMGARTALVNEVHGLLHEYGIVLPKGVAKFRQAVVGILEAEKDKLTPLSHEMFWKLVDEFAVLEKPHSIEFSGRGCHRSSKASGGEDLQIEEPVCCGYSSAFHFHATLPGMLGATLIRDEVVQVGEPREKRLLAATGMMEPFHREQFPLDGVMGLIQQGAGRRHLRVCEHRIPARFLVLKPAPYAFAVGRPQPWWRRGRQSGVTAGPAQTPASPCAGAPGTTGCGTASATPCGPGTRWPPVSSGAC